MERVLIEFFIKIFICYVCVASAIVVSSTVSWADPFRFDGNWTYRQLSGDQDDQTTLGQTYRLTFDKSLNEGMSFTGSLRYTEEDSSTGADSRAYNPTAAFDLRNDMFAINLNGSSTQREIENRPGTEQKAWNVSWFSLVRNMPKLRLNFGQNFTEDDQSPKQRDSVSSNYGANLSHSYQAFRFLYDLRVNTDEDFIAKRTTESKNQLGQLQYQQSFLQQKLTVSASEQVSFFESKTEVSTEVGALIFQLWPLSALGGAFFGNDDTPTDGTLTAQNGLLDQNFSTAVVEVLQPAAPANLGVRVNFNPVNRMDVYFSDVLSSADASQLVWTAYTSNDNFIWTQIPIQSVTYVDDLIAGNLATVVEVSLVAPDSTPLVVDYVKVVVTSPGLPAIINSASVSELEVGLVSTSDSTINTTKFETAQTTSRFGINYRPSEIWSISYNFGHSSTDNKERADRSSRTHSLATTYVPVSDISLTANLNESLNAVDQQQERLSRTMSLSMYATPFATLNYSLGYTRSENFTDDEKTLLLNTVTLHSSAQIFPDLSSTVTLNWAESENLLSSSETSSWSTLLRMTARISPKLNLDADYSFTHTQNNAPDTPSETTTQSAYGGTVSYRPSSVVFVQSRISHQEPIGDTLVSGTVSWRVTPRLQLGEDISMAFTDSITRAYTSRLTWNLGPHFKLNSSYSYQLLETGDTQSLFANMSANF